MNDSINTSSHCLLTDMKNREISGGKRCHSLEDEMDSTTHSSKPPDKRVLSHDVSQ